MYYARVGVEVLRLVGRGQGMGLPYVSLCFPFGFMFSESVDFANRP